MPESRKREPRYRVNRRGAPVVDNRRNAGPDTPRSSSPGRVAYKADRLARRAAARALVAGGVQ